MPKRTLILGLAMMLLPFKAFSFDATKKYNREEATIDNVYYGEKGIEALRAFESEEGLKNYVMDEKEIATQESLIKDFMNKWRNSDLTNYTGISEQKVEDSLRNIKVVMGVPDGIWLWKGYAGARKPGAIFIARQYVDPDNEEALQKAENDYKSIFGHEAIHQLGIGDEGAATHLEKRLIRASGQPLFDSSTKYLQQENIVQGIIAVVGSQSYFECMQIENDTIREQELEILFKSKQNIMSYHMLKDIQKLAARQDFADLHGYAEHYVNDKYWAEYERTGGNIFEIKERFKIEFFEQSGVFFYNEGNVRDNDLRSTKLLKALTTGEKNELEKQCQAISNELYSTYNFALGLPYDTYEVPDCDYKTWQELTLACNKYLNTKRAGLDGKKELEEANKICGSFIENIVKDGNFSTLTRLAQFVDRYNEKILGKEKTPRTINLFGYETLLSLNKMYEDTFGNKADDEIVEEWARGNFLKLAKELKNGNKAPIRNKIKKGKIRYNSKPFEKIIE